MRILVLILFTIFSGVVSWDSQQLEVFDVVEEVKANFYKFLSVPQVFHVLDRQTTGMLFRLV